jgi:hypothetical protein
MESVIPNRLSLYELDHQVDAIRLVGNYGVSALAFNGRHIGPEPRGFVLVPGPFIEQKGLDATESEQYTRKENDSNGSGFHGGVGVG